MQVTKKDMKNLPEIWAIDFDGTLVTDCYPNIGEPDEALFKYLIQNRKTGVKLILWTCRDDENLVDAIEYCRKKGLIFDAHNCNIPEVQEMFNNDTRKVYANLYVDDKSLLHQAGRYGCHSKQ